MLKSTTLEVRNDYRDSPAFESARRARRHALIFPREHGAWGLLLVPMTTGAGVALRESSNIFPFILLLTAALALFWLRTPVESLLAISPIHAETEEERNDLIFATAYLAVIAGLALSMLLWDGRNSRLLIIAALAGAAFIAQAALKALSKRTIWKRTLWEQPPRLSRDREAERAPSKRQAINLRMLSELVGAIALTSSAPAAYYVISGKFGLTAWMLWLANLLFAGNQIHYVQLRIHTARVQGARAKMAKGWTFAAGQLIMTAILAVTCLAGLIPWIALVAFVPVMLRGWMYFVQKPAPLVVRRLGWNELAQAVVFCILFVTTV